MVPDIRVKVLNHWGEGLGSPVVLHSKEGQPKKSPGKRSHTNFSILNIVNTIYPDLIRRTGLLYDDRNGHPRPKDIRSKVGFPRSYIRMRALAR